jgi:hypothetical protein
MPLEGLSSRLEENQEGKALLRFSDFSGGVGTRFAKEHRSDLRALLGYWFGYLDTWSPGITHLPLLSTATTPTGISASKSDYASMIEAYIGGAWRVILVKGTKVWQTTGAAFGAAAATVTGAQGRQVIELYASDSQTRGLVWFAGANGDVQYSLDGTTWQRLGAINSWTGYGARCLCGWSQFCKEYLTNPATWRICGIEATTRQVVYTTYLDQSHGWSHFVQGGLANDTVKIPALSATDVIPLGPIEDPGITYLANGPQIWAFQVLQQQYGMLVNISEAGLPDVTAGCKWGDRMAITDGTHRIKLWHPTQDPIDVSLWNEDGVPDPIRGGVKALQTIGDYLIAWWEMDNASPVATANRGNTMLYWSRPNLQGQTTWHPRSGVLTGGFPLSMGSPMVLAEKTITGKRRLWTCTADETNGRAYYQDHPGPGYNPTADTAAVYSYEDGPKYLYTAWEDLQLMGDEAGTMTRLERNGIVTSTEVMDAAMRVNNDVRPEEPDPAGWDALLSMKDTRRHVEIGGGTGVQANNVQLRIGLDRGSTATKTPILLDMAMRVQPNKRQPTLERM